MCHMRIVSWNANGIRAAYRKGFAERFNTEGADIVCLQETKANVDQLDDEV